MLSRILAFLTEMDSRRWRTAAVTAVLLAAVVMMFLVGKSSLGVEAEARMEHWLQGYSGSPWAFAVTVLLFVVSAFLGAPQFILIAACVVAFGPSLGFWYSWAATVISAGVTYWLGRGPTARLLDRLGSRTVERLKRFVGRNAFYASFVIRNVPSAPFIVVNMAFGATRANFWAFLAGCALGVLPKTALVAFFGGAVFSAVRGDGIWHSVLLAGAAALWLVLMLAVREWIRRRRAGREVETGLEIDDASA
ncbi:TVP38/TMEM64 family protein [Brevundimonas aveniformis]|uniref:TVP38/TMEM64 family protein n=1 Tax=Brevundimonas aveniformis TaxID=370977 RepID=UPI00248FDCAB|nr:VTT domain-containing protein [Brevundimonas aveniformis]